jgi:polar amino acid transport system substrate-binding protein
VVVAWPQMRSLLGAVALAAASFVLLFAATASAEGAVQRLKASGVLRWGGDLQGGEPYAYEDPRRPGQLAGFEVELADAIAKELGVRAEFHQNDWSQLVPSLERGTFDVILNGLEVTRARVGRIAFSRPYYVFAERLMARKDDARITGMDSLAGKRTGTLANSLAHELLRDRTETVLYEGVEEPYLDLSRGRTDGVLLDDIIAARYGQMHEDLRVVGDVAEGYYAVGILPGEPDLKLAVDRAIANVEARGELTAILRHYAIDNARQERLASWSDADQSAMLETAGGTQPAAGAPAPPPGMTLFQVWLFVKGALMTLLVSVLAMAVAVPLGITLALGRSYAPGWVRRLAGAYVEVYRGTPMLLQLYVLYYGLASVVRMSALATAVVGLGMNYAAYEAEVYRAGIAAVPKGQMAAAYALGMSTPLALRRVLLPQAFRLALPNVTNDFIALLKDSSLVSVITVVELTKQMTITAVDLRSFVLPGVLCAALYFAMSYPLSRVARVLEARLARG